MELVSTATLATFASDLTANVADSVDSVWVIALVVIAIPLAFYILRKVIGLFPKR